MDGVCRCNADGVPTLVEAVAPHRKRVVRAAAGRHWPADEDAYAPRRAGGADWQTYPADPDADGEEARTVRPLQAAAVAFRIAAFGADDCFTADNSPLRMSLPGREESVE